MHPSKINLSTTTKNIVFNNPNHSCSQAFYVLPSLISDISSSLGYGNKYDFSKMANKYPGPNAYDVSREFDERSLAKKGISIGIGREV